MKVKKPIFIIGTGRSGSTVLAQLFAGHTHLAWHSRLSDRYPNKSYIGHWIAKGRKRTVRCY